MGHKSPIEILRCAKAKLRKGWCQGWFAKTKRGWKTQATSPSAASYCMLGALQACSRWTPLYDKARKTLTSVCRGDVVSFNDMAGRTKAEVLAKYDAAIAKFLR